MKAIIVDALATGKGKRKTTKDVIGAGPRTVAGILDMKGIKHTIIEAENFLSQDFNDDSDLLMISGMTSDLPAIRKITKKWKNGPIIIGGPVTSDPEYSLQKTNADIAVIGEGEETLQELLEIKNINVQEESNFEDISGIAYKGKEYIKFTKLRPVIPRKIFDKYFPSTSSITGYSTYYASRVYVEVVRGCSNYLRAGINDTCNNCLRCNRGAYSDRYYCPKGIPPGCGYCSVPSLYGPPKSRSILNIRKEVEGLLNKGVTRIVLSAPCFLDYGRDLLVEPEPLTNPKSPEPNYYEIDNLLQQLSGLHEISEGNASLMIENIKASLVTEEAAKTLGKWLRGTPVSVGFETGSKEHSDWLGRPSTPEETLTAIKRLRAVGMIPYVYFIHGLPGQSKQTVEKTTNAIESSMSSGAERIILYRFQSLPMSTFSAHPSAPPSIRDSLSKKIYNAASNANKLAKHNLVGEKLRVVVSERYEKNSKFYITYPLKHGPVVLVESQKPLERRIIDVEITGVVSERMVYGRSVATF